VNEVYRGYLEECLRHLSVRFSQSIPRGTRGASAAKKPVADFCGVTIDTVTRWLNNSKHLPVGEQYIKLMCFLDLQGYKVLELERMKPKFRNFAMLIGYGLITSEQATEMLGYSNPSTFYQLLRGDHGAGDEKERKMWDMWKARKDELDDAIEKARTRFRLDLSPSLGGGQAASPEKPAAEKKSCPSDGLIEIMHGLVMMLDSGILNDLSDRQWAELREAGGNTILRLSSHLSSLSARLVKSGM
jgi:hypothetical protein